MAVHRPGKTCTRSPDSSRRWHRARPVASRVAVAAALLLFATSITAQTPPGDSGSPGQVLDRAFSETLEVKEVELWVRVERKGVPVKGLRASDFRVLEDGQELEIVFFQEVDRKALSASRPVDLPPDPAAVAENARTFLFVFDLDASARPYLKRGLEAVRTMVSEQRLAADRVAVATRSGPRAALLLGPSVDGARIHQALDVIGALIEGRKPDIRKAFEALDEASRGDSLVELANSIGLGPALLAQPGALPMSLRTVPTGGDVVRQSVSSELSEIADVAGLGRARASGTGSEPSTISDRSVASAQSGDRAQRNRALVSLASLLSDVYGEKHLILLSQGFGRFTESILLNEPEAPPTDIGIASELVRSYRETVQGLQRAGWIVDPFDLNLLGGPGQTVGVDQSMFTGSGNRGGGTAFTAPGGTYLPGGMAGDGGDSLWLMAYGTGGKLYDNRNRFEGATADLIETTHHAYHVVFRSPELERRDRFRPVRVELVDGPPGARVLTRSGYFESPPVPARFGDSWLSASNRFWAEPDVSELPVRTQLLPAPPDGATARFTFAIRLDLDLWHSAGDRPWALVQAVSARGREHGDPLVDVFSRAVGLGDSSTDPRSSRVRLVVGDLEVPAGGGIVGIRVVDPATELESRHRFAIAAQDASTGRGSIAAWFRLDPEGVEVMAEDGFDLRDPQRSSLATGAGVVLPSPHPILSRTETASLIVLFSGDGAARDDLQALVLATASDRPSPARLGIEQERVDDDGRLRAMIVRLETSTLEPGDYELILGRTTPEGAPRDSTSVPFTVR